MSDPVSSGEVSSGEVSSGHVSSGQSVAEVKVGEVLTERQALEALLLPSANNLATLLAEWDAGSEVAFVAKMNAMARRMGLVHTRYVDASGYEPGTVSTARDQVRLALSAIRIRAFATIVDTKQVPVPADVATKHAIQYIKAQRAQEAVRRQFGAVVSNPKAKVVYNKAYAPPPPPPKGTPTQGGSAAPASTWATSCGPT